MASVAQHTATTGTSPITIKVAFEGSNRKFKLPLQDLNAATFAQKIRSILQIPETQRFILERFSDSGNAYITLDQTNPSAYKQLYRAAKAKLKLRIRATLINEMSEVLEKEMHKGDQPTPPPVLNRLPWIPQPTNVVPSEQATSSTAPKGLDCVLDHDRIFHQLSKISREREIGRRMKEAPVQIPNSAWQIFCNECDKPLADAHFHCSICDGGDYDLCETCVEAGKTCEGEGHWLIKRFIKHGRVVNSTTETLAPKPRPSVDVEKNVPGAFAAESKIALQAQEPTRTCNSCVRVLPELVLCTCKDCPDFDLCVPCLDTQHGHHPGHTFEPLDSALPSDDTLTALCAPGGNTRHHAICDGCDETIYGVRHKCLNCPDWDFCSQCFAHAGSLHPGHRFVPVYSTIDVAASPTTLHFGILCDGPLCSGKTGKAYIKGIRYKCAVCHDTDFCANCEAHPSNKHNISHPLVKFKTPVKGANITTFESQPGRPTHCMGDKMTPPVQRVSRCPSQVYATMTDELNAVNEASIKPEPSVETKPTTTVSAGLDAHFESDSVADGTKLPQSTTFEQAWNIRNPGPHSWPIGCSVSYVGGDNIIPMIETEGISIPLLGSSKAQSNVTDTIIEPGQAFRFAVNLQAPPVDGRNISYWRVKTADGNPFGHKLWCDIEVVAPAYRSSSPPLADFGGALADYQMQLMLLEQQNKRRLMMHRAALAKSVQEPGNCLTALDRAEPATTHLETIASADIEKAAAPIADVMVFPTLEKESPSSSTYQDATSVRGITTTVEEPTPETNVETAAEATSETETVTSSETADERFEDLESVEYEDSDANDGFMTDEEYDILDASDEEVPNHGKAT